MAGRGPAPKDPTKRRRRNTQSGPSTTVSADGRLRGPQLPKNEAPLSGTWHPRTKAWWTNWRKSPQAKTFVATDWDFLLDTAMQHHLMWTFGKVDLASEIRLRVAKFGATIEDRTRLKMEIETPSKGTVTTPEPAPAGVTDIRSRQQRLVG